MPLRLLFPGIELLSANGGLTPLGDRQSVRPVVLIARELCAFERRATVEGGVDAARQRARQAAPFLNSGFIVRREGRGFAIWWWDLDRVRQGLVERFGAVVPSMLPWSLAVARGDGWRVLRLEHGFEAQFWEEGALLASAWRREPYDRRSWSMFTRLLRRTGAPVDPPVAIEAPVAVDRVRAALLPEPTWKEAGAALAAGVAGLMLMAIAWSAGQGLRYSRLTEALPPAAAVAADTPQSLDRLRAFRTLSSGGDPVAMTAVALGALEAHGVRATAWTAMRDSVRLTLPYSALPSLDRIAADLRAAGEFERVQSTTDVQQGVIELILTPAPHLPSPGG